MHPTRRLSNLTKPLCVSTLHGNDLFNKGTGYCVNKNSKQTNSKSSCSIQTALLSTTSSHEDKVSHGDFVFAEVTLADQLHNPSPTVTGHFLSCPSGHTRRHYSDSRQVSPAGFSWPYLENVRLRESDDQDNQPHRHSRSQKSVFLSRLHPHDSVQHSSNL